MSPETLCPTKELSPKSTNAIEGKETISTDGTPTLHPSQKLEGSTGNIPLKSAVFHKSSIEAPVIGEQCINASPIKDQTEGVESLRAEGVQRSSVSLSLCSISKETSGVDNSDITDGCGVIAPVHDEVSPLVDDTNLKELSENCPKVSFS